MEASINEEKSPANDAKISLLTRGVGGERLTIQHRVRIDRKLSGLGKI